MDFFIVATIPFFLGSFLLIQCVSLNPYDGPFVLLWSPEVSCQIYHKLCLLRSNVIFQIVFHSFLRKNLFSFLSCDKGNVYLAFIDANLVNWEIIRRLITSSHLEDDMLCRNFIGMMSLSLDIQYITYSRKYPCRYAERSFFNWFLSLIILFWFTFGRRFAWR